MRGGREEPRSRFLTGILAERAPADARLSLLVLITLQRGAESGMAKSARRSFRSAGCEAISSPTRVPSIMLRLRRRLSGSCAGSAA